MKRLFIFAEENSAFNYVRAIKNTKIECEITCSLNPIECKNHSHLLLCGGGDVNPLFYEQEEYSCNNLDHKRDLAELFLINYFYKRSLPILGICRGMQILNVAFGGDLMQSVKDSTLHFAKEKDINHPVENVIGLMKNLYGNYSLVNSAHRQAVNSLGKNLAPLSFSDDRVCEAFLHENKKILGVQFHPERMGESGLLIYQSFLKID